MCSRKVPLKSFTERDKGEHERIIQKLMIISDTLEISDFNQTLIRTKEK